MAAGRGLVEGDAHGVGVDGAQVDATLRGPRATTSPARPGTRTVSVSNHVAWTTSTPPAAQAGGEDRRQAVHALGDAGQAVGPVPHGVQPGDVGQQHLGGADVRRGLLPADVLLTGLEGEAQRRAAGGVGGHADQAAGQRPGEGVAGGEEGGVGTAEAHRHAEALRRADGDVGAPRRRARASSTRASRSAAATTSAAGVVDAPATRGQRGGGGAGPTSPGCETSTPKHRGRIEVASTVARPPARCRSARPGSRSTAMVCGWVSASTKNDGAGVGATAGGTSSWPRRRRWPRRASRRWPGRVPVRSATIVWKLRSASSRPWLISGWYGV